MITGSISLLVKGAAEREKSRPAACRSTFESLPIRCDRTHHSDGKPGCVILVPWALGTIHRSEE